MKWTKLLLISTLLVTGCKHIVLHPGAINAFDSQSYDVLVSYKATIDQTKAEIASGQLPASAKTPANDAINAYNVARAAYIAYHDAAQAGQSVSNLQSNLTNDLNTLVTVISNLEKAKGLTVQ